MSRDFRNILLRFWPFESHFLISFFLIKNMYKVVVLFDVILERDLSISLHAISFKRRNRPVCFMFNVFYIDCCKDCKFNIFGMFSILLATIKS